MRRIHCALVSGCLWAGLVIATAGCVSANPSLILPDDNVPNIVSRLFLVNLPMDMFLFASTFLFAIWTIKSPLWSQRGSASMLTAEVAVGGVAIAATGALIDFYALFTEVTYSAFLIPEKNFYIPELTLANIALAGAAVFGSVYAVSVAVVRLRPVPSLIPAALMTGANLFAWVALDGLTWMGEHVVIVAGLLFLFVPPLMFGIVHAHGRKVVRQ